MTRDSDPPPREFRVWVDGRLSEHFTDGLEGVDQTDGPRGSILYGDVVDDAHLQGVLDELRSLGITFHRFEVTAKPNGKGDMHATTRVEDLKHYGKPVSEFPKAAERQQRRMFVRELRARYGTLGLMRLLVDVVVARRQLRKRSAVTLRRLEAVIGPGVVKETMLLASMFDAIARREGRAGAYPVIRSVVEQVAPHSMRALYQVDDLTRCDGDAFENFKRFHAAMFDAELTQELYPNTLVDDGDHFATTVERCANVEIFNALGYPELGPFGCDHDCAGYAAIADEVQVEFRRPHTIAKGGDVCDFHFYRAGTAPDTELIDGARVEWHDGLNR